jgi:hypothetical protein
MPKPHIICVRPSQVPLARHIDIRQPGGPVEKINAVLNKPWTKRDISNGRRVEVSAEEERDPAVLEAILAHYRDAEWDVEWHHASNQRDDSYFTFKMPKQDL